MKLVAFVIAALAARLFAADATPPAAVFPTELKLTSGVTLHHASPTRWTNDYVVVKHVGGLDPIQYRFIAPEQRAIVAAVKEQAGKPVPPASPPIIPQASASNMTIEGQAFIVTRGAGNYKLGGMLVYVFPLDRLAAFDGYATVDLGIPTATATTDAEGKFKLKLSDTGDFFLFARSQRLAGGQNERYEWLLKSSEISDRSNVLLSSINHREPTRSVTIGN